MTATWTSQGRICRTSPRPCGPWRQDGTRAGVWVFAAGLEHQVPSVVATDGTVTDGPYPESKEHIGGFTVVDVPSREAAIEWAAKIAAACRCAQQVFELMPDDAYSRVTSRNSASDVREAITRAHHRSGRGWSPP